MVNGFAPSHAQTQIQRKERGKTGERMGGSEREGAEKAMVTHVIP